MSDLAVGLPVLHLHPLEPAVGPLGDEVVVAVLAVGEQDAVATAAEVRRDHQLCEVALSLEIGHWWKSLARSGWFGGELAAGGPTLVRRASRPPPHPRRPRRDLPPPSARGDRGSRRPAPARAVRPADGVGEERRVLHRDEAAARRRAPGRPCSISPLLALMRNQIEAARAARDPRRHGQLDEPRRLGRGPRRSSQRRRRPAPHQPRAAEQPAVPRGDAAAVHRARRAARRRRGALRLGLGARLPPRLPPHQATSSPRCATTSPSSCTTATANDRVVDDVAEQLESGAERPAHGLPRPAGARRACASRS